MRTTLVIDDDVLAAARERAQAGHETLGRAVSELARLGIRGRLSNRRDSGGIRKLPVRPDAVPVTLEMVNRLRDDGA